MQSSRPDLIEALKESTRGTTAGTRRQRLRSTLVILEVSLAMVLLIGAGLMLKTFLRLYSAPAGCDTRNVVTFQVSLPGSQFVKKTGVIAGDSMVEISPRVSAIFEQIRERVSSIPCVQSAGANVSEKQSQSAAWFPVSAGYFHVLGVPIVRGRQFRIQDSAGGSPVVLINEAMARRFWFSEDPIGKRLRIDLLNEPSREIVGVVGNIRHNRYEREILPQMYVPYTQQPAVSRSRWLESRLNMTFVVRAAGDPGRLVPALRTAVTDVDRNLPIFKIKMLDAYIAEQLWQPQQTTILLAVFGAIAVVLAMAGVYGIMAYVVRHRTHEIDIRMALGATTRDVLRFVIARGLLLIVFGSAMGVGASLAVTPLLKTDAPL